MHSWSSSYEPPSFSRRARACRFGFVAMTTVNHVSSPVSRNFTDTNRASLRHNDGEDSEGEVDPWVQDELDRMD